MSGRKRQQLYKAYIKADSTPAAKEKYLNYHNTHITKQKELSKRLTIKPRQRIFLMRAKNYGNFLISSFVRPRIEEVLYHILP